jgi:hypothetical protein
MGTALVPATAPQASLVRGAPSPQRIRWGSVFAGAILGIALLATLTALWLALAYGSGIEAIRTNLEWYVGGSAIGCLFAAGLLSGWLSGVRGAGSGFLGGLTIWALALLLSLAAGVPAVLTATGVDPSTIDLLDPTADTVLWVVFFSIVGGLVASGLGGAIGGALARPANAVSVEQARAADAQVTERPTRPDVEQRTVVVPDAAEGEAGHEVVHSRRGSTS